MARPSIAVLACASFVFFFSVLPRSSLAVSSSGSSTASSSPTPTPSASASATLSSSASSVSTPTRSLTASRSASKTVRASPSLTATVTWSTLPAPSQFVTTIMGTGVAGTTGTGGPPILATVSYPTGLAYDCATDTIFVGGGNSVRAIQGGVLREFAGNGSNIVGVGPIIGDGGPASSASIVGPRGMAVLATGDVLILEYGGQRLRRVFANRTITTLAGNGTMLSWGDGGPAALATLNKPQRLAVSPFTGDIVFSENGGQRIRIIYAATGIVQTLIGNPLRNGSCYPSARFGDGGPVSSAGTCNVAGLAFASDGSLFFAEMAFFCSVRRIDAVSGIVTTVVGTGVCGADAGDGGPATLASVNQPSDLQIDLNDNLYLLLYGQGTLRFIDSATGVISRVAGGGTSAGSGQFPLRVGFIQPEAMLLVNRSMIIADSLRNTIRVLNGLPSGPGQYSSLRICASSSPSPSTTRSVTLTPHPSSSPAASAARSSSATATVSGSSSAAETGSASSSTAGSASASPSAARTSSASFSPVGSFSASATPTSSAAASAPASRSSTLRPPPPLPSLSPAAPNQSLTSPAAGGGSAGGVSDLGSAGAASTASSAAVSTTSSTAVSAGAGAAGGLVALAVVAALCCVCCARVRARAALTSALKDTKMSLERCRIAASALPILLSPSSLLSALDSNGNRAAPEGLTKAARLLLGAMATPEVAANEPPQTIRSESLPSPLAIAPRVATALAATTLRDADANATPPPPEALQALCETVLLAAVRVAKSHAHGARLETGAVDSTSFFSAVLASTLSDLRLLSPDAIALCASTGGGDAPSAVIAAAAAPLHPPPSSAVAVLARRPGQESAVALIISAAPLGKKQQAVVRSGATAAAAAESAAPLTPFLASATRETFAPLLAASLAAPSVSIEASAIEEGCNSSIAGESVASGAAEAPPRLSVTAPASPAPIQKTTTTQGGALLRSASRSDAASVAVGSAQPLARFLQSATAKSLKALLQLTLRESFVTVAEVALERLTAADADTLKRAGDAGVAIDAAASARVDGRESPSSAPALHSGGVEAAAAAIEERRAAVLGDDDSLSCLRSVCFFCPCVPPARQEKPRIGGKSSPLSLPASGGNAPWSSDCDSSSSLQLYLACRERLAGQQQQPGAPREGVEGSTESGAQPPSFGASNQSSIGEAGAQRSGTHASQATAAVLAAMKQASLLEVMNPMRKGASEMLSKDGAASAPRQHRIRLDSEARQGAEERVKMAPASIRDIRSNPLLRKAGSAPAKA